MSTGAMVHTSYNAAIFLRNIWWRPSVLSARQNLRGSFLWTSEFQSPLAPTRHLLAGTSVSAIHLLLLFALALCSREPVCTSVRARGPLADRLALPGRGLERLRRRGHCSQFCWFPLSLEVTIKASKFVIINERSTFLSN
jgi:hypothetical protein